MVSLDDCATVVETDEFIKVQVEMPVSPDNVTVDEVEGGILVQVTDGEEVNCFVPLPSSARVSAMQAVLEDNLLRLLIPKAAEG